LVDKALVANRCYVESPFPNEISLYFGGFDPNSNSSTNMAWVFKKDYQLSSTENFQKHITKELVYPNPNTGVFFIDPKIPLNTIKKVQVLNLSGQLIYEVSTPKQHQINTEEMLSGAYIVVIKLDKSLLYSQIILE
jgi:hypothetical protein